MILADLISRPAVMIDPQAPVADAVRLMREKNVGSCVVVEDTGEVVGIVTDRDIVLALVDENASARELGVGEVMTPNPVCLAANRDVERALARMRRHGIRRMPVLSDTGELVGVVALDDILMHMSATLEQAAALVREGVAVTG